MPTAPSLDPSSLLIVTGPPGAGKSTLACRIAERLNPSVLVEGDAFFAFLATGAIEPWLPESNQQNGVVTDAAGAATARFVAGGYNTVYDGVVGPWFLPRFLAGAGLLEAHYVVLLPPVDVCLHRVRTRVGHGFSDEAATRKMHEEFSAADVEPRHVLPTSSDDVTETMGDVLSAVADGTLRYRLDQTSAR